MVPEELTNERYSPGRGGQIKAWLTPIIVDYTAENTGGIQAVDQLKCRLAFKIAICGERGVERKKKLKSLTPMRKSLPIWFRVWMSTNDLAFCGCFI